MKDRRRRHRFYLPRQDRTNKRRLLDWKCNENSINRCGPGPLDSVNKIEKVQEGFIMDSQHLGEMIKASAAEDRWARARSTLGAASDEEELKLLKDRIKVLEERLGLSEPAPPVPLAQASPKRPRVDEAE